MDLDNKSKFIESHQLSVLRQMLTFAREALNLETTITLNPDFSGYLGGGINARFDNIGEAVEAAKQQLKAHMAKNIDNLNKRLRQHIEQTKEIAANRDEWKALGEQVIVGKYEIPETPLNFSMLEEQEKMLKQMQYPKNGADYAKVEKRLMEQAAKESAKISSQYNDPSTYKQPFQSVYDNLNKHVGNRSNNVMLNKLYGG